MTMMMNQPSRSGKTAAAAFLVVGALATTAVDSFSIPMPHHAMISQRNPTTTKTTTTTTRLALGVSSSYLDSLSSAAAPLMPVVPGATDVYLGHLASMWLSSSNTVDEVGDELEQQWQAAQALQEQVQQQLQQVLEQQLEPPTLDFNMDQLSTAFSSSGEDGSNVMAAMADAASSSSSSVPTESLWDMTILDQTGASIDAATATNSVMEKANSFIAEILAQVATKLEGVAADTASALNSAVDGLTHQKVIALLHEFGAFLKQVVYVFLQLLNTFLESLTGMTLSEVSSTLSASITSYVSSTIDTTLQNLQMKIDMISNMSVFEFASALMTLLGAVSNLLYSIANAIIKTASGRTVGEWAHEATVSAKLMAVNMGEQTLHTVADLGEKSPAELAQGLLSFLDTTTQFAAEAVGAVSGVMGETTTLGGMMSSSVGLSMSSVAATMSTSF